MCFLKLPRSTIPPPPPPCTQSPPLVLPLCFHSLADLLPLDPPQELVEACLSDDHTQRPSFDDIVSKLEELLAEAERRAAAAPPAPAAA